MTEKYRAYVIANCLERCVRKDVCSGCEYEKVPDGERGVCIDVMMSAACDLIREMNDELIKLRRAHEDAKENNLTLRRELKRIREQLDIIREFSDADEWNESDTED